MAKPEDIAHQFMCVFFFLGLSTLRECKSLFNKLVCSDKNYREVNIEYNKQNVMEIYEINLKKYQIR